MDSALQEVIGFCKATEALVSHREKAVVSLQTSRKIHEGKVNALNRVKTTSRAEDGKVATLNDEVAAALADVGEAERAYEDMVDSMKAEVAAWHAERKADWTWGQYPTPPP